MKRSDSVKELFLGVDTSNYTTSASLCDSDGKVIANVKKLLPVPDGQKGLRQSDALFNHTVQLPDVMSCLSPYIADGNIVSVGVSARPRDAEGSYMPCFLAGVSAASSASSVLDCPLFSFSHQCGHIMAALYSSGRTDLTDKEFIAFHVSGGTTDILHAEPDKETVFRIERIGGTLDLNAGQVIDRAGVMMGLGFPCGPELEKLALSYNGAPDKVRVSVNGFDCNLSGVENKAGKLFGETGDRERCAAFVISFVCETLKRLSENLKEKYPGLPFVYAGGVMSCKIIRNELAKHGSFAEPEFSSDNAAGTALMTRLKYYGLQ